MSINIDDSEVQRALARLKAEFVNPSNLQKLFRKIANVVKKDIREHFRNETGPAQAGKAFSEVGQKWAELSPVTKANKAKKGTLGKGKLVDSGKMKKSIKKFYDSKSAGMETSVRYARTHQNGKGKVPARSFFWFSRKAVNETLELIENNIKRAWRNLP